LIDVIGDVSPDDNPLMTMLKTTKATGTYHEWTEEYIARPTSVTYAAEGAAATYSDLTQPVRRGNITNIITETFRVSGTERAVSIAGMGDPYSYQQAKALRRWKNKAEFTILRGAKASGSSGVAREMDGITSVITTIATARNSGTSLSENEFNGFAEDSWKQGGNDNVFDLVLVPGGLKRKISSFTAGSTRYVDATDKKLVRPVMVYESDFGVHRIMAHHDLPDANGTSQLVAIKEDLYRIAYLRPPKAEKLAKDGDRDNGQIVGEFTLEWLSERTSVLAAGYNKNG